VQVEALAVRLRPRTAMEAADLGVYLCRSSARSIYPCYTLAAIPVVALAFASSELARWLPSVVIWCAKPWLDRTILFVLSRAAFGQQTTVRELWNAQRAVWWGQLLFTLTVRRLSLWRSMTQPVYQLEDLSIREAGVRIRQLRHRNVGAGTMMTGAFSIAELALTIAVFSLIFWLAPAGSAPDAVSVLSGELPRLFTIAVPIAYGIAVLFLEPFYVGAGFGMYLNRRAELEAWDIEQEFRRAFAH
jgi:hypothetical protein